MNQPQPEIAQQLAACGIAVFPCWDNKQPAIKEGFKAATITLGSYWPSPLVGVAIPDQVVVIDIDTHKGMTTDKIDSVLGCSLDWSGSLLQNTPSGGSHHGFYVTGSIRQGADLFWKQIGKGFDTRISGRGYICTGGAYGSDDPLGILKLASPSGGLPPLPPSALTTLSAHTDTQHEPAPLPTGDRNADEILKMLRCLDADCSRDEWLRVGLALKHHYHDNDDTGWVLFDNWSKTGGDAYGPHDARKLWDTVKPTSDNGGATTTLATIAHKAIEKGYIPSSIAAEIFGTGDAQQSAPQDAVEGLIDWINHDGGDIKRLNELTSAISQMQCNSMQHESVIVTLIRVLKEHGHPVQVTKIRNACKPLTLTPVSIPQFVDSIVDFHDIPVTPIHALGNVHLQNATLLVQSVFGDRLGLFNSILRWWNGSHWQQVDQSELKRKVAAAFHGSDFGKNSIINGTVEQLYNIFPAYRNVNPVSRLIFFRNGVMDLTRPDLGMLPHHLENYNTFTLSVNYEPETQHPEWTAFLDSLFNQEPERKLLIQEIFGWALITDNLNQQKAAIFDGKTRSGKGASLEVLNAILGQSMIATPLDELHDHKHLSNMRDAMVATDMDAKGPPIKDIRKVHGVFNKLTANEKISLKLLWEQSPWVGRLNCKLIMASNGIPVISDDAGAAPNRWVILKFTESFLGREDGTLVERLIVEKAAITAWAVEGLRRLMITGHFTTPASSLQETDLLIQSSSPVTQFIEERLIVGENESCLIVTLYESYKKWIGEVGGTAATRNNLRKSLLSILPATVTYHQKIRIDNRQNTGFSGVGLRECVSGLTPSKVTPISQAFKKEDK